MFSEQLSPYQAASMFGPNDDAKLYPGCRVSLHAFLPILIV
jgi:hypothetical protein